MFTSCYLYLFFLMIDSQITSIEFDFVFLITLITYLKLLYLFRNPNLENSGVDWKKLQKGDYNYLRISDTLQLKQGLPFPERMALWESLFPLSGPYMIYF